MAPHCIQIRLRNNLPQVEHFVVRTYVHDRSDDDVIDV